MSPELKQFYVEIQQWIDAGCPANGTFNHRFGLCTNVDLYAQDYRIIKIASEQRNLFIAAFDDYSFPFYEKNEAGTHGDEYFIEKSNDALYKNPQRLAWIKQHAEMEI